MSDLKRAEFEKQKLLIADADNGTVTAMLEFGELAFSEVLQRSAQIDTKLGIYIAYAVGILALLSLGNVSNSQKPPLVYLGLAAVFVFSVLAVCFSAFGLKARSHEVPGDEVWINDFKESFSLRKSYIVALLRSRQFQRERNNSKVEAMQYAEICLLCAGVAAAPILIYRILVVR